MTMNWKCVFLNDNIAYFAKIDMDKVTISDGISTIREYRRKNINGCSYDGETLWLSITEQDDLIAVDKIDSETIISIKENNLVRIIKAVTGQKNLLFLETTQEDKRTYSVFDCALKTVIVTLPITINMRQEEDTFYDLYIDNNKGCLLCEYQTRISARYSDEVDDTEILFYAEFTWSKQNQLAVISRGIRLIIDYEHSDSANGIQTLIEDSGLRFPLFNYYLYHWLKQKSFSSSGLYIVYYCPDISGIIIGSADGGKVYRIFKLPHEVDKEENQYYFNDFTNLLYVVDQSNKITRYLVECTAQDALEKLNAAYDKACQDRINLASKRDAGDLSFWRLLNIAIENCNCIFVSAESNYYETAVGSYDITIEIETPISGTIALKQTGEILAVFEDWDFKKTITINENNSFEIIFTTTIEGISKEIYFDPPLQRCYYIYLDQYFGDDEIIKCCNRHSVRYYLQENPTNVFATNQLGYVGTAEDYNFLLGVLEDYYCKSVLYHGHNAVCAKSCIRAVYKLALYYKRKDAIPVLRKLLILADDEELENQIREYCVELTELRSFLDQIESGNYRVDLDIQTDVAIDIYMESKDFMVAKIDSNKQGDNINCCCLRSSSNQFDIIITSDMLEQRLSISADDGILHYLHIHVDPNNQARMNFGNKNYCIALVTNLKETNSPVILERYLGRPRRYINFTMLPNKVTIPNTVTNIEENAFGGESVTEVLIPESVVSISDSAFQYSALKCINIPRKVTTIGKSAFEHCDNLEIVILPNKVTCIADSCFKDCMALTNIIIPDGVSRIGENAFTGCVSLNDVIIQDGVQTISAGAFSGCYNLACITIPNSVTVIESRAFDNCKKLIIKAHVGSFAERYARRNGISFKTDISILKDNFTLKEESFMLVEEKKKMIFISHSTKDKEYIKVFVELLETLGIREEEIVCSSIPPYCVPLRGKVFEWLVEKFQNCKLHVIYMLSHNYYNSPASLNEMGAAWAMKQEWSAILLPGFGFKEIAGCIDSTQIGIKLDDPDVATLKYRLGELKDLLVKEFDLRSMSSALWERKRDDFLDKIADIKFR